MGLPGQSDTASRPEFKYSIDILNVKITMAVNRWDMGNYVEFTVWRGCTITSQHTTFATTRTRFRENVRNTVTQQYKAITFPLDPRHDRKF